MINVAFSRVADRLLVADPGLLRLRTASRVAVACGLTGTLTIGWTLHQQQPLTLAALAIIVSMIAPLFVRDAGRASWFVSLLSIYLCACATFTLAVALCGYPLIADAGFLVVLFAGILCQACGPRALGCALTGVVTYYLGLYLHPTPAHLVHTLLLSLVGPAMLVLAGRVIVPARPARTLARAIQTVSLRATRLLAISSPRGNDEKNDIRSALSSLNEAALALEEQLSLLTPGRADGLRERLVEVEIAAGLCAFDAPQKLGRDAQAQAQAQALRDALARLNDSASQPTTAQRANPDGQPAPHTGNMPSSAAPHSTSVVLFQRLSDRVRRGLADVRSRLCWLPACRATAAALLAMLIGHSLSPERWFWAVITTFVVFLGTRSRADTIHRGIERLAGTLAGAIVSVLLADTLHAAPLALIATMLLCVFGWAYYILNSYSRGVFFITILVGLVYTELGFGIGSLVELRIGEVLIGCVLCFAVAIVMVPLSATRHIDARLLAVLQAMRTTVGQAVAPDVPQAVRSGAQLEARSEVQSEADSKALWEARPGAQSKALSEAQLGAATGALTPAAASAIMRTLDRSWHDLQIALRPFRTQRVFVWNPSHELITGSLLACLHWVRTLSALATQPVAPMVPAAATTADISDISDVSRVADGDIESVVNYQAASILARLDALIASYDGLGTPHIASGKSFANGTSRTGDSDARSATLPGQAGSGRTDPAFTLALDQLDAASALLADRLARPTAQPGERFRVERRAARGA